MMVLVVQVLLPCTSNVGIGIQVGGKASEKHTRRHQQVVSICHLGLASTLSFANQALQIVRGLSRLTKRKSFRAINGEGRVW